MEGAQRFALLTDAQRIGLIYTSTAINNIFVIIFSSAQCMTFNHLHQKSMQLYPISQDRKKKSCCIEHPSARLSIVRSRSHPTAAVLILDIRPAFASVGLDVRTNQEPLQNAAEKSKQRLNCSWRQEATIRH